LEFLAHAAVLVVLDQYVVPHPLLSRMAVNMNAALMNSISAPSLGAWLPGDVTANTSANAATQDDSTKTGTVTNAGGPSNANAAAQTGVASATASASATTSASAKTTAGASPGSTATSPANAASQKAYRKLRSVV
ncbi:hypothetical protein PF010_g31592, partial [Phytophthora fragariae]